MAAAAGSAQSAGPYSSSTFERDVTIKIDEDYTAASISPSGRDVVLAGRQGLLIIDLDNPYSPPRNVTFRIGFEVADVQWSPFAAAAERIASTNNNKALIFNLNMKTRLNEPPIEFTLDAHSGNITDINFSAHRPYLLATCALDTYVYTWDLRTPAHYVLPFSHRRTARDSFADWQGGATQVKWNRKNENLLASSHDRYVQVWDIRHGARPISTIQGHFNKVYGIDWHRSEETKILTCSLDKTVKQWDGAGVTELLTTPTRTISTQYPLLRARHTPFPNGIVTMPQQGSGCLSLYTQGAAEPPVGDGPPHVFRNDASNARLHEFLWRSRGNCENGMEDRDFQLVTWGTDHHLRLHSVSAAILTQAVGFEKGKPVHEPPNKSRRGAQYVTYRESPQIVLQAGTTQQAPQIGQLSAMLRQPNQQGLATFMTPQRTTMTAKSVRRNPVQRVVTHVKWMHNVNIISKRTIDRDGNMLEHESERRHDLAVEIARAGQRHPTVTFDNVALPNRQIVVAFRGPWGDEEYPPNQSPVRKSVFLRLTIRFPDMYPTVEQRLEDEELMEEHIHPLEIAFERTTAAITPEMLGHLKDNLNQIARAYANAGRPALDAVLDYALGDRPMDDIMWYAKRVGPNVPMEEPDPVPEPATRTEEQSSSEEENDDSDSGEFTNDLMHSSHSNANLIPMAVQATVRISNLGSVILARLPKTATSSTLATDPVRLPRHLRQNPSRDNIFETFGRIAAVHDSESPASSVVSWESSSSPSSSSGSGNETESRFQHFLPPLPWQKPSARLHTQASLPVSMGASKLDKSKSIVTILHTPIEQFIPSKKVLAEEYLVFGDGPVVCSHNAEVARKYGFEDLADIWNLCRLILNNQVPLDILPQQHRREQVLVLARRALVRIKRKDSGLDLQFDEADTVTNPKLRGRVKWGRHPVVSWLIPALFDHFERLADTQMLAMLSCVFSEPAAREGVTSTMAKMRPAHLTMSMEAPAFSLDYFSSADAAWSLFKPTLSIPSTPAHSRYATPANEFGWNRFSRHLDTYGSHGSSNGPWGSDTVPSEPMTPYSTGHTPPTLSRATTFRSATTSHTPYSTSPELSQTASKKTPSGNFASAIATLSKPFVSSSPPVKSRTDDLSTSAPTSGVTWGTTTFYSSGSNERNLGASRVKHGKRASFGQAERVNIDYISDSDSEYDAAFAADGASEYTAPLTPGTADGGDSSWIRITLKNQDRFDDEACVSAPLLDKAKEWLYRAWREQYAEMLGCWDLVSKRAEVLKFNGLVSYFPFEDATRGGGSKAGSMHLALKKGGGEGSHPGSMTQPLSRASTLAPPGAASAQFKRSPMASPQNFSFNPEATEFKPGDSFTPVDENGPMAPPADVFISSEQYLRLSIPTPPKPSDTDPFSDPLDGVTDSKLLPYPRTHSQPSLSRAASNISGHSTSSSRLPTNTSSPKKGKRDPIYSCSICWIRVSGRFYLCPACGHVAHFDCMDDELGMEEGECVVGCGCGCGFEENEEQNENNFAGYITGVRGWEERGGWMPEFDEGESMEGEAGGYGEPSRGRNAETVERGKKKGDKETGEKKREKGKGKKKAIVTGKSYF